MKKGIVGILCIFSMRLILTIIACLILRFGVMESVALQESENAEWVSELQVADSTHQIMIVIANGTNATLSFYQKEKDGCWLELLTTEAYIGKNGIGKVREGDNRTPIGKYSFTKAFGVMDNPGTKLNYIKLDQSHYWVDDANSTYYNQLVSIRDVRMDWESAEHLCEYQQQYRYALAINYNEECEPGVGSAIFLHCITNPAKLTAGCIAIPEMQMRKILQIVEEECVLVIDTAEGVVRY